jgi:hypothetical protein
VLVSEGETGGVVLAGGGTNTIECSDTWRFDGYEWDEVCHQGKGPNLVNAVGASFDGGVVVFGAEPRHLLTPFKGVGQTWIWSAGQWQQRRESPVPDRRYFASLAYNPPDGAVVMFGGVSALPPFGRTYGDTWAWTAGGWRELELELTPPKRSDGILYWDADLGGLLLLGGFDGMRPRDDAWLFCDGSWHVLPGVSSATPGQFAGWAHNPRENIIVCFGSVPNAKASAGLWIWSDHTWRQHDLPGGPGIRPDPVIAFASALGAFVLTGGTPGARFSDTWTLGSLGDA